MDGLPRRGAERDEALDAGGQGQLALIFGPRKDGFRTWELDGLGGRVGEGEVGAGRAGVEGLRRSVVAVQREKRSQGVDGVCLGASGRGRGQERGSNGAESAPVGGEDRGEALLSVLLVGRERRGGEGVVGVVHEGFSLVEVNRGWVDLRVVHQKVHDVEVLDLERVVEGAETEVVPRLVVHRLRQQQSRALEAALLATDDQGGLASEVLLIWVGREGVLEGLDNLEEVVRGSEVEDIVALRVGASEADLFLLLGGEALEVFDRRVDDLRFLLAESLEQLPLDLGPDLILSDQASVSWLLAPSSSGRERGLLPLGGIQDHPVLIDGIVQRGLIRIPPNRQIQSVLVDYVGGVGLPRRRLKTGVDQILRRRLISQGNRSS